MMELTVEEKYALIREKLRKLSIRVTPGEYPMWAGGPICDELERILYFARTLPK